MIVAAVVVISIRMLSSDNSSQESHKSQEYYAVSLMIPLGEMMAISSEIH